MTTQQAEPRHAVFFFFLATSAARAYFCSFLYRFRCSVRLVTSLWILGAFFLLPVSRRTTNCLTSSFLSRLNIFRMLEARFGPRRRGFASSVRPSISSAPFFRTTRERVAKSGPTMQPRTDLRLRQPLRRSRKQDMPFLNRRRTRWLQRTPCFIGKPCLSLPPEILKVYPWNWSPSVSPETSAAMRLS